MAKLVRSVYLVDFGWLTPDDEVPAEAAEQITNPKAWENGEAPGGEKPSRGPGRPRKTAEKPEDDKKD